MHKFTLYLDDKTFELVQKKCDEFTAQTGIRVSLAKVMGAMIAEKVRD